MISFFLPLMLAATPAPKAPDGFKVELILEAPAIEAPTALAVASNGDVYFAEDPMDMRGPPTKNIDSIWLLPGGDPKKKVLFADKMWAVMGLEVVGDKLYVVHAPWVSVFTLNPDGTAKSCQDLFDDLGPPVAGAPSFNDHVPSGIRMGMDGYLYVSIGDKGIPKMSRIPIPKRMEPDAQARVSGSIHVAEGRWRHTKDGHHISLEGGGVIRFRPDGSQLEVFASGTRNHLDVPMDEHDRIFVRDNTDDGLGWNTRLMYLPRGAFMGYPWAYKQRPQECLPMIKDFGGGSPCGGWVYCDDGLPAKYQGRIFHCEWAQQKVWAVKVAPDGAGFKYVDQIAFLDAEGTGLKDFRPFTLRPTADGRGFYVTDWANNGWSNKAVAGRLWKVTYTGKDVAAAPRGKDTDSVDKLIEALGHPAHSERLRAQRALIARGKDVAGMIDLELRRQLGDRSVYWEPLGDRHDNTIIGALWVLANVDPQRAFAWLDTKFSTRLNRDVRIEILRILSDERIRTLAKKQSVSRPSYSNNLYDHVFYQHAFHEPDVHLFGILADYYLGKRERLQVGALGSEDPFLSAAVARVQRNNSQFGVFDGYGYDFAPTIRFGDPLAKWIIWYILISAEFRAVRSDSTILTERLDLPTVQLLLRFARSSYPFNREFGVRNLARNYKDRKPYAGGWWGTQPAAQKPPRREVAWEGTPLVRDAVVKALADADESVRAAALAAIIDWADPETLQPLTARFAEEKSPEARGAIVRAVAALKADASLDFLGDVLGNKEHAVPARIAALTGLAALGRKSELVICQSADAAEPPELHALALRSLGDMKSPRTVQVCKTSLAECKDAQVVESAMKSLASRGDPTGEPLVLPRLIHESEAVRKAAIEACAALKLKAAVPELVRLAQVEGTQFEAIRALTTMPDLRALPAYLSGITSKNPDLRKASRGAILAIRDAAVPSLEELAKRNELLPEAVTELQAIYARPVPMLDWRLKGPFPGHDTTTAYPPESEQNFATWIEKRADLATGKINLGAMFTPNQDVCAYGYAEFQSDSERDARLVIGSDDTIVVWLNGAKVHTYVGYRSWNPEADSVNVKLRKGKNTLLIKCGNGNGPWEFSVAVTASTAHYGFLKGGKPKYDLAAIREFASKTSGDPSRGAKLFLDPKGLACAKCHAVGGEGGKVGPDLAGIGAKYDRDVLMTAILEPSKVIAQGYETVVILTTKGTQLIGVFKGETGDSVRLADNDGKEHAVPKSQIDDKSFSPVSTMPNGLSDGMTLQDFADLVAYLESKKEKK